MTKRDILVFQTNWPENIDILYCEKDGMTRASCYLLKDGDIHSLLLMTDFFPTKEECQIELGILIEGIMNAEI